MASLDSVEKLLREIKDNIASVIAKQQISANQVKVVAGLSDITERLGLIQAGEFRSGNGKEPGTGFTGGRYGYPGFSYTSNYGIEDTYFLVGVDNDALQVGLSLTRGTLIFGEGNGFLDSSGLYIANYSVFGTSLMFGNATDTAAICGISTDAQNDLDIYNTQAGRRIIIITNNTDDTYSNVIIGDDESVANKLNVNILGGVNGEQVTIGNIYLESAGSSGGATLIKMEATPTNPSWDSTGMQLYMKGSMIVIHYLDGATDRWKYLDLAGTGVTWVHSLTAP